MGINDDEEPRILINFTLTQISQKVPQKRLAEPNTTRSSVNTILNAKGLGSPLAKNKRNLTPHTIEP